MLRFSASASRRRRAGLREDSLRLHDFGQRFAQRRELVVRDPGTGFSRAGIFLEPRRKLGGAAGSADGPTGDRATADSA